MKIAIIGVGKIGEAIARALKDSGYKEIIGTVRTEERLRKLSGLGIPVIRNNREAVKDADVVFICVKPHQVRGVLDEIRDLVKDKLIISVAAAVTTEFIERRAPGARVIRAMPNINIVAKSSVTAICPGKTAREEDLRVARELFDTMGSSIVIDEVYMDAVTAYSGSGPAYALVFFESLLLAGMKIGLPRDVALKLAVDTMTGTARLLEKLRSHPAELRDMVITPGGVTIEAIHVLERNGFRAILMDAINEAYRKSKVITESISGS